VKKVKRALIIANTWKKEAALLAQEIGVELKASGVEYEIFEYDGLSVSTDFTGFDVAITLGGDGTVLFAARYCTPRHIPVFPVNLGEFGFIAGIQPHQWKRYLKEFLEGRSVTNERMLLEARVERSGTNVFVSNALNDAVISGSGIAKIVRLEVLFNGLSFGVYKADGVIVATPTGSTAYSAASGGPIVDPDLSAFVLTPICAFSLSNRPIVLPPTGTLRLKILEMRHKDAILTIDGQEVFHLLEGDVVYIDESPHRVRLIGCDNDVFYTALRSKLNWSGTPVPDCGGKDA